MNDFTKDELIKIQDCVNHQCYTQPFGALELARICEKLQSMIETYLEDDRCQCGGSNGRGECNCQTEIFE